MSISEFRRITGFASEVYSDEQIEEMILQLDYLARLYINKQKHE